MHCRLPQEQRLLDLPLPTGYASQQYLPFPLDHLVGLTWHNLETVSAQADRESASRVAGRMLAKMSDDPLFQCVPLKRHALTAREAQRNDPMIPQVLLVQLEVVEADLPLWKREDAFTNSGGLGDRVEASKRDFLRVSYSIGQKQREGHRPNCRQRHRRVPNASQHPLPPDP